MSYTEAKERYAACGVDVEQAIETLKTVPVSLHCWQGDDVRGFDTDPNKPLTGGIQTTGNYPGRARTPEELMADLDKVLSLIPGKPKMNLHASYAIFENGEFALLQPNDVLKALQDEGNFTRLMVMQEELKTLPFGEVWNEYCRRCNRPADGEWFKEIEAYEKKVLEARA